MGAWVGGLVACAGGVRFSNSNRIIPSNYRILLLLKMPIPISESDCVCELIIPGRVSLLVVKLWDLVKKYMLELFRF